MEFPSRPDGSGPQRDRLTTQWNGRPTAPALWLSLPWCPWPAAHRERRADQAECATTMTAQVVFLGFGGLPTGDGSLWA